MKEYHFNMNIDLKRAIELDPSITAIPLTPDQKEEFRQEMIAWEKAGKKGERPLRETKHHSSAEMWRFVVLNSFTQVQATGNRRMMAKLRNLHLDIQTAVDAGENVFKATEEQKNFIRSCFDRADKWENSEVIAELVYLIGESIDAVEEVVKIDSV